LKAVQSRKIIAIFFAPLHNIYIGMGRVTELVIPLYQKEWKEQELIKECFVIILVLEINIYTGMGHAAQNVVFL